MPAIPSIDFAALFDALWQNRLYAISPDTSFFAIAAALLLWLYSSCIFQPPQHIFKRRVAIVAWIVLPSSIAYALFRFWLYTADNPVFYISFVSPAWAEVASAVFIGNALRHRLLRAKKVPDPLALPFSILVCMTTAAYCGYVLVYPNVFYFACDDAPFSIIGTHCGFLNDQFNFTTTALAIFVVYGMLISPDSFLIQANRAIGSLPRTLYSHISQLVDSYRARRRKERKRKEDERAIRPMVQQDSPLDMRALVPAGNISANVRTMCLKIRRSQKSSVMGKMLFALDARMELPAEEHSLVAKYRLFNEVVYESNARKEHRSAAQAHLERTRDHASFRDSAKTQAWSLTKTLYRFGRTGISATRAALALRVTVESLIRGVHVECKDMDELLSAEEAIVSAARNLKTYLEAAVTFDGREQIIEL